MSQLLKDYFHKLFSAPTPKPVISDNSQEVAVWGVPRLPVILGSFIMLGLCLYFLREYASQPACCDALDYRNLADTVDSQGIDTFHNEARTFLYPWFLATLSRLGRFVNLPFSFLLLVAQLGFYILATFIISRATGAQGRRLVGSVYVLLCCNIFIAPYIATTLTDALYTALSLILIAQIMQVENKAMRGIVPSGRTLGLMVALASASVAVRPAAVWLFAIIFTCFTHLLIKRIITVSQVICAIAVGCLPLLVQVVINIERFKQITPFPITDLGTQHLKWGIENFKYATWMAGDNTRPVFFYKSDYSLPVDLRNHPLLWYVYYPLSAIHLLTFKLISAFDFDFLLPYPRRIPTRPWLVSAFSLPVLFLGMCGVLLHARTKVLSVLGFRFTPLIIVAAWASVSVTSATELRFVLPLISYFLVVSCVFVHYLFTQRDVRITKRVLWAALVALPCFFLIAGFVRSKSPRVV
jgi:hypothetical protein